MRHIPISFQIKSSLHLGYYVEACKPKRVRCAKAHLCSLVPVHCEQHSSEEMLQQWRVIGDTVFKLSGPESSPRSCAPMAMCLGSELTVRGS